MKTRLLSLLLLVITGNAFGQNTRTTYDGLTVVGTPAGKAVQLTWKKGSEDVYYFIVERSNNGVDFTQCAIVFTSEEPGFTDYKFREKIGDSSQGLVYRLALVSQQRRISYLPAKTLISPTSL